MKLPNGQRIRWRAVWAVVIFRAHEIVWASRRRRRLAIKIARQQAVSNHVCRAWRRQKADHGRVRIADQRLSAVQRISAHALKWPAWATLKLARAKVIGVRPHPTFRIIGKVISTRTGGDGPTKIRSERIICL